MALNEEIILSMRLPVPLTDHELIQIHEDFIFWLNSSIEIVIEPS